MWALLLVAVLVMAACGNDAEEPEAAVVETVDLDEIPTVADPTPTPMPATPTSTPEPTVLPLPELLVWPTFEPEVWAAHP